jgi:hypothetical protein
MTPTPPSPERIQQALAAMHKRRAMLRRTRFAGVIAGGVAAVLVVALVAAATTGTHDTLRVAGQPTVDSTTTGTRPASTSSTATTTGPPSTATTEPPTSLPVASPTSVATTTVPAPTTSTTTPAATTACTHLPTRHVHNSYYGLPAPNGSSLDYRTLHNTTTDDGRGNSIQAVGLTVEMRGPQGTLRLAVDPSDGVGLLGWGDFDGDGRTDLLVQVVPGGVYTWYIVPGTVGPGSYTPAAVGVLVPDLHTGADADFSGFPEPVGDQNGDGADDIGFGSSIYSGRDLAAGQPGPTPFARLTSPYVGILNVDAIGRPAFVVPDEKQETLRVLDHHADRLRFGPGPVSLSDALNNFGGRATAWLANGHHIVQFEYGTRAGATQWRWDLDAACGT